MSTFVLKIVALICMLIDHAGHIGQISGLGSSELFYSMRMVGRMAFPIYVYLIANGANHTGNIKKYMRNLFIFALISEIPFDLFMQSSNNFLPNIIPTFFNFSHQNVFFTLFLGVLSIYLYECISKTKFKKFALFAVLPCMYAALFLRVDYHYAGVFGIFFVYYLKSKYLKSLALIVMAAIIVNFNFMSLNFIFTCIPAFLALLYNGKKGTGLKWGFYLIYPIHLLLYFALWTYVLQPYFY